MKASESFAIESEDQLAEKIQKLKAYEQNLEGKKLQLDYRERTIQETEDRLRCYRKKTLTSIRDQLEKHRSKDATLKVVERYRDILAILAEDVQLEIDEIMA